MIRQTWTSHDFPHQQQKPAVERHMDRNIMTLTWPWPQDLWLLMLSLGNL